MTADKSVLLRLEEQGRVAPRVHLKGTERRDRAEERYQILGEIARGGVGAVHRGRDHDLGRDVALKVLLDEHLKSPELVQRFVEEAQIGGQLQHPGIVPVYELGLRPDRRPYFAMKLVKGETLAARLAQRADPADERRALLAVFREICRTMAYAHARGVIHRDLKPSNVMIGNFGEVQVVDWGFAKILRRGGVADERLADKAERAVTMISTVRSAEGGAVSVAGSVLGTPAYMPPEQALGRVEDLDERSDLFSLGAVLCEILTGKPPYAGTDDDRIAAAAQALLEPAHARLDACDADDRLIALCKHCLQALPKERPSGAAQLADEVAAYLTDAEGRAHRAKLRALQAQATAEQQRRGRRLTTLVASSVVATLLVAASAYIWIDAGRTQRERERQSAIETALQDASRLRAAQLWPEALAAAERAIAMGDDGTLATTIRTEAQQAAERERRDAEDAALLTALEEIRAGRGEDVGAAETDAAYVAAITRRWPDFDVDSARLHASPRALAFAAVFDSWAHMRRTAKKRLKGSDWRQIDELARRIDPDHAALRDAFVDDDSKELVDLATSDEARELPTALLATIGAALFDAGRHDEATDLLKRAHRAHPGDAWINHRLGQAAYDQRDHDTALRHFSASLAVKPQSVQARHWIAMTLEQSGDLEGAVAVWQDALELRPEWLHGLSHIGQVLSKLGRSEEARVVYLEIVDLDPTEDSSALNAVGVFLNNQLKKHGEAVDFFRRAIDLNPLPIYYRNLGIALGDNGQIDEAIEAYREVLAMSPSTRRIADVREGMGFAFLKGRRFDEAIAEFEQAIELDPDSVVAHTNLGTAHSRKGEREKALAAYRKVTELAPDDPKGHIAVGWLLCYYLGDPEGGVAAYRRAVEVAPTHAAAQAGLGVALRDVAGDLHGSRDALQKAVELDPTAPLTQVNFGVTLNRLGQREDARRAFEKAIELDSDLAIAWANLGSLQVELGETAEGVAALRQALQLHPDIQFAFVHNMLGRALLELDQVPEAIESFQRALRMEPRIAGIRYHYGRALARNADLKAAIQQFGMAITLYPAHAAAHASLGEALLRSNKPSAALKRYRRAFKLDPAIAADARQGQRYNAACVAALSAEPEQALAWLRADLEAWEAILDADAAAVAERLAHWKQDPDLASVRDADDRSDDWKQLWVDVDTLWKRARDAAK